MQTSTKVVGGGILLLGLYALLKPKTKGDVVPEGEELVIGPPTPSTSSITSTPVEAAPAMIQVSVEALQTALVGKGFSVGSTGIDGSYGPVTEAAWRAYARSKGLPEIIERVTSKQVKVAAPTAASLSVVGTAPSFLSYQAPRVAPTTRDTSSMTATPVTSAPTAAPAPVVAQGTPGTLRVDVDLDVSSFITGIAMDKIRTDVLAPTKLKSLLAYVAKNCPTVPKMTGAATGAVAKGGSGLIITVRVPVLFTQAPNTGMVSCVTAALKKSNSEVRDRLQSLTLKAER